MTRTIYLLNGPNLDLLGEREPQIYGRFTLEDIEALCRTVTDRHGLTLTAHQTNAEHEMIQWLHDAREAAGIVINPAAFCYHSVPILDALKMCAGPIVEVHISNIYRREDWRSKSILATAASGVITGLGIDGYRLAMEYLVGKLPAPKTASRTSAKNKRS
jgi:3-dehydroquinate dehydratase II